MESRTRVRVAIVRGRTGVHSGWWKLLSGPWIAQRGRIGIGSVQLATAIPNVTRVAVK